MTALLKYFDLVLSNIGQVKFSHDNGYSLGVPLGLHRLHRNVYLILGMTLLLREKNYEKLPEEF